MEVQQRGDEESRSLDLDDSIFKLCLKQFDTLRPSDNQCLSPVGVHQMLSLLLTFTRNIEIKRKLAGLMDLPLDCHLSQLYNAWEAYLTNSQSDPLKISLALFSRESIRKLEFERELAMVKNKYCGDIIPVEDPLLSPERIDKWIESVTAGTTRKINVNLDYVKNVLMVSSLTFKGEFRYQHWEIRKDMDFYIANRVKLSTDFMRTIDHVEYAENSDLRAIKLEYENPDYYLLILQPKDDTGRTNQLERIVTSSTDYLTSLKFMRELIDINIPRFFIQNEMNVLGMLHRMCPNLEDLTIFSTHAMYVNTIKQVNLIDVRERKTLDDSFSWENEHLDSEIKTFYAIDPFVYMLYHGGKILIAGRCCNPAEH